MALTKVTGHVVLPTTNIEFHNTKSTGIVSFTHTSNATSSTTGALQITGGVGIVKDLFVGGNITVGGTITYDDVTNIDSLGIITARNNIHLQDYIYHRGEDPLNSYFGFSANDTIEFFTTGERRLKIQSTGRIGINTDDSRVNGMHIYDRHLALSEAYPITWLQPNSSASRGRMTVDGGGNYLFQFGTGNEEKIRFKSNGNIGIGTNNPAQPLHIYNSNPVIRFTDIDSSSSANINATNGNFFIDTMNTNRDVIFRGGSIEAARITGDGNLGIGTHPTAEPGFTRVLHVYDDSPQVLLQRGAASGAVKAGISVWAGNAALETFNATPLRIRTDGNTNQLYLKTDGNVGIATDLSGGGGAYGRLSVVIPSQSGGSALQVMNSAVGSGDGSLTNIVLRSVNNSGTQWAGAEYRAHEHIFKNQGTEALRITSGGKVAIGTDNPTSGAAGARLVVHLDDNTAYAGGTNRGNGIFVYNEAAGGHSSLELAQRNAADTYGTVILNAVDPANGNSYGADFTIQTRATGSGNYGERFRITSSGNVGIKTTAPQAKLELDGRFRILDNSDGTPSTGKGLEISYYTSDDMADILSYDRGGGSYKKLQLRGSSIELKKNNTVLCNVGTGGNGITVGFSTTNALVTNAEAIAVRGYSSFKSPSATYAAIYTNNQLENTGVLTPHILFNNNGANRGGFGYHTDNTTLIMANHNDIMFKTGATQLGGTEALRITSTSNVGIGTNNPTEKLDVLGNLVVAESIAVNRPRIVLSAPNDGTNYRHLFGANLKVDSSGTFTTPTANISGGGWEYLPANNFNDHGEIRYISAPDTNSTSATIKERFRIKSDGNVGIGTDSIGAKLTVSEDSSNTNMDGHNYLASQSGIIIQNRTISSGHFTAYTGNVRSNGGYTQSGSLAFEATGSGTTPKIHITQRTGSGVQSKRLTIDTAGKVGINSTSPNAQLDVMNGTIHVHTAGKTGVALNSISNQDLGMVRWAGDYHHAIILRGSSNADGSSITAGNTMEFREYGAFSFKTGNNSGTMTERFRINTDGTSIFSGKITNSSSYTSHNANFYGGNTNTGGVRIEVGHNNTTVSGNTAQGSFPHHLQLTNYSKQNSADDGMITIGFDIPTTSTHANGVIAYQATAPGTGDFSFHTETGNTIYERLRITSDGKVGINDNNPSNHLVVKYPGGSGHTAAAVLSGDGTTKMTMQTVQGSEGRLGMTSNHPLAIYAGALERARFTSTGGFNCDLGDNNTDNFQINGNASQGRTTFVVKAGNATANSITSMRLVRSNDANPVNIFIDHSSNNFQMMNSVDGGNMVFHLMKSGSGSSLPKFRIMHDGKVSLGNSPSSSPLATLHVRNTGNNSATLGGAPASIMIEANTTDNWQAGEAGAELLFKKDGGIQCAIRAEHDRYPGDHSFEDCGLAFYTSPASEDSSGTRKMLISSTGTLIISDDPWSKFTSAYAIHNSDGRGVNITTGGRIYCKTDDHWDLNHVGTGEIIRFRKGNDSGSSQTQVGQIDILSSGVDYKESASDSRLKKNVETWADEVLPHFKTLQPKKFNFNWESDSDTKSKGYMAQDVTSAFPEAFSLSKIDLGETDSNGDPIDSDRYMFSPGKMVPYLMKALQEEIAKREALEARISALEGS